MRFGVFLTSQPPVALFRWGEGETDIRNGFDVPENLIIDNKYEIYANQLNFIGSSPQWHYFVGVSVK